MSAVATALVFREVSLLFKGEMVRAILDGRKSQTRRVLKSEHVEDAAVWADCRDGRWESGIASGAPGSFGHGEFVRCPYGVPGDHLWVKETFSTDGLTVYPCPPVWYRADCGMYDDPASGEHSRSCGALRTGHPQADCYACAGSFRWRPSIFMPRKLSRITLEIAEVCVQRLQEISEDDARAEGVRISDVATAKQDTVDTRGMTPYRAAFTSKWDEINGKRRVREYLQIGDPGYTVDRPWRTVIDTSARWDANPWIWAITFRRIQ